MSVLNLLLLVHLKQKVSKLVLSITYCPTIIILESALNKCIEKCSYGNFDCCYVSSIHFHVLLGVGIFTKVVHVCAERL
jgi:hypothetical protein